MSCGACLLQLESGRVNSQLFGLCGFIYYSLSRFVLLYVLTSIGTALHLMITYIYEHVLCKRVIKVHKIGDKIMEEFFQVKVYYN